jgi:hypothetical protein
MMKRAARGLGLLGALLFCVSCGDGKGTIEPPLNAGPGVNSLATSGGGGGGGGGGSPGGLFNIIGDWFPCDRFREDGSCRRVDDIGFRFAAGGIVYVLIPSSRNLDELAYCVITAGASTYTLQGNVLTLTIENNGERATVRATVEQSNGFLVATDEDGDRSLLVGVDSGYQGACSFN